MPELCMSYRNAVVGYLEAISAQTFQFYLCAHILGRSLRGLSRLHIGWASMFSSYCLAMSINSLCVILAYIFALE